MVEMMKLWWSENGWEGVSITNCCKYDSTNLILDCCEDATTEEITICKYANLELQWETKRTLAMLFLSRFILFVYIICFSGVGNFKKQRSTICHDTGRIPERSKHALVSVLFPWKRKD